MEMISDFQAFWERYDNTAQKNLKPCEYGHLECTTEDGGLCSNEVFGELLADGLIDENGEYRREA